MISNAHFWNAGARSYNPICLNPLLVLDKISPLPGSSENFLSKLEKGSDCLPCLEEKLH